MDHNDYRRMANSQTVTTYRHPATRRGWFWTAVAVAFVVFVIWALTACDDGIGQPSYTCTPNTPSAEMRTWTCR